MSEESFEEFVRSHGRALAEPVAAPTYHGAWRRGRRRRLAKRGALVAAGAFALLGAVGLNANRLGGGTVSESDEVAVAAPTAVDAPPTIPPTIPTTVPIAPVEATGEAPDLDLFDAGGAADANGVEPSGSAQTTATEPSSANAPGESPSESPILGADNSAAAQPDPVVTEPAAPGATTQPESATPPSTKQSDDNAPAAGAGSPTVPSGDETATAAPDSSGSASTDAADQQAPPADGSTQGSSTDGQGASGALAGGSDTTMVGPAGVDDPSSPPGVADPDPDLGDAPGPDEPAAGETTLALPDPDGPAMTGPAGAASPPGTDEGPAGRLDGQADAIVEPASTGGPAGQPCDAGGNGVIDADCLLLATYACTGAGDVNDGYLPLDSTGDGAIDSCVAAVSTSCDLDGDGRGDLPCLIVLRSTIDPDGP